MTELAFHIRGIPAEQVEKLTDALKQVQVDFNPERDLFFANQEAFLDGYFTGDMTDVLVEAINSFTKDKGPKIKPASQMTLEENYALLEMAQMNMNWKSNYKTQVEGIDQREYQEFQEKHPSLFVGGQ